jgi:hypothetical protein
MTFAGQQQNPKPMRAVQLNDKILEVDQKEL